MMKMNVSIPVSYTHLHLFFPAAKRIEIGFRRFDHISGGYHYPISFYGKFTAYAARVFRLQVSGDFYWRFDRAAAKKSENQSCDPDGRIWGYRSGNILKVVIIYIVGEQEG